MHLTGVALSRVVPVRVARFWWGRMLEFDLQKMVDDESPGHPDTKLRIAPVQDEVDREQLRQCTFNTTPSDYTGDDLGYGIRDVSTGRFVGGLWISRGPFFESNLGYELHLPAGSGWLYCAYIEKDFRGGGLYRRLLANAAADLKAKGFERLFATIVPWNKSSNAAHRRCLIRSVGELRVIRIGRLAMAMPGGGVICAPRWTSNLTKRSLQVELEGAGQ